ncbi:thiol reductant ABC exporter subunit CydD [Pleomorphomonas sp. NRK KF1]|uniref:thiol reductant ABC exporter subunit CydD n=1 Tax=Pleomorphomonas sp. NRK KF1 TaxID=2943000 RepID=UPI00204488E5|nr:thiol reductant ABC exporter subunit CydD [Pleomorphomonas sp. NRK KF1]MCM5554840.1 thiol reductant ABC exporter subunit CydD [Pleomorphomonas sp. NRK KF1]
MSKPETLLEDLSASVRKETALLLAAAVAEGLLGVIAAFLTARVIDAAVFKGADLAAVFPTLIQLLGIALLKSVIGYAGAQVGFAVSAKARQSLFARLLDHVAVLGPVRLSGTATGDVATTLTDAVSGIEPYWRQWLPATAAVAVLPAAILLAVLPVDWRSAVVFAVTLPLLPLFMVLAGRSAERANQRQWASMARLGGHLLDAVAGLADLVLLGAAKREVALVARTADGYRRETMKVLRLAFLSALVLEFFATVSIAVTAVLIGFRLLWGEIAFVDGLTVLLLAPAFYAPLRTLGTERHARMEAVAAAERLADFLARPASGRSGSEPFAAGEAVSVRFDNVSAGYGDGRLALDGVSFEVRAGEQIAIVGESGAGKSTILSLIAGFLEPEAGTILIDGRPLASLDIADVRRHIAFLPQRAFLFDASVAENVAMGRSGDVAAALRAAHADEFVGRLSNGADSRLGEGGAGLSGGEMQRLMLARAFFSPAPLVLMDEPTAHLDAATEAVVGEAIARLSAGRTRLTIAHRLKTVEAADRVLVFSAGRLVEEGKPDELKARGGEFATMLATLDGGGSA